MAALYGPAVRQTKRAEEPPPHPGGLCGTYAAYQQHYKRGEKPCAACRHAATVYQGQWRVRNGRTDAALVPYAVLGALLLAAPTDLEEWAEKQLGDAVMTRALEAARECST